MTQIVKQLVQENPQEWEQMLPYAECIIRITPSDTLVQRSPYQVVTGLQPKLPRALIGDSPVITLGVGEYVSKLLEYLRSCYRSVRAQTEALREEQEVQAQEGGTYGMELNVGDLVMIRLSAGNKPKGSRRFHSKVQPEYWRIKEKISPQTFRLCSADDESVIHEYTQAAENLIRIELPELDFDPTRKRIIDISDKASGRWVRMRIEKFSVDGRCLLRRLVPRPGAHPILTQYDEDVETRWVDLSRHIYRWVV